MLDDNRFGLLTRAIQNEAAVRRDAVKGALGAALGLSLGKLALGDAAAKKKKKKCKKCPKCPTGCTSCSDGNDAEGCCDNECCLHIGEQDGGFTFCRGSTQVCCTAEEGGGACNEDNPFCCPPTPEDPQGFCSETAAGCDDPSLRAASGSNGRAPRIDRKR